MKPFRGTNVIQRDAAGNPVDRAETATVVPDDWTPNRKWFAAAAGVVALNGLALLGVDVGAVGVDLAELAGLEVDEASIEGATRTAVGALAGQYLWPEWRSLPDLVRGAVRKLTRSLRGDRVA